jgi:hypothetical protein
MRSLTYIFGGGQRAGKALVAVDVENLMRENVRLQVENIELRCKLGAGGRGKARSSREKVRDRAVSLAAELGLPRPTFGIEAEFSS